MSRRSCNPSHSCRLHDLLHSRVLTRAGAWRPDHLGSILVDGDS